jgi:hypothetical protein
MNDNRGTELLIGRKVAYNLSGEIAIGTLINITPTERYGRKGYIYHVRCETGYLKGNVSKVTSHKNLMVIYEQPTCAN